MDETEQRPRPLVALMFKRQIKVPATTAVSLTFAVGAWISVTTHGNDRLFLVLCLLLTVAGSAMLGDGYAWKSVRRKVGRLRREGATGPLPTWLHDDIDVARQIASGWLATAIGIGMTAFVRMPKPSAADAVLAIITTYVGTFSIQLHWEAL